MRTRTRTILLACIVVAATSLTAARAGAQALSHPTLVNNSNPDETVPGTASTPSRERESEVDILSSSSGAFVTRYFSLVTTDGDGAGASAGSETLASDYEIDFTVTAPGAYQLTVATQLSGDMNLVNDSPHGGAADVGNVIGSQTGGVVTGTGSLSLPDPGSIAGSGGGSNGIDESDTATIFGVSNGAAVPQTLHFSFFQSVQTDAGGGDEAAVRLGDTSHIGTETAGDYPGTPMRVQADDGHFVTVTLTSLCGNGTIDSGPSYTEQCDDGPANGTAASCCNTDCTFKADDTPCDDNNVCTSGETCTMGVCGNGTATGCPNCQVCDAGMGCIDGPRVGCKLPTIPLKSKFQLKKGSTPATNLLAFSWLKGLNTSTTDFGEPVTDPADDYALCVFTPGLALKAKALPAMSACGTRACWKVLGIKGFAYADPAASSDGMSKISLKAGLAGKAKALVKGKGTHLPALPLPLGLPAKVQLQAHNGKCWEADFSSAGTSTNTPIIYKGKSD
jgi:hypothetical protein